MNCLFPNVRVLTLATLAWVTSLLAILPAWSQDPGIAVPTLTVTVDGELIETRAEWIGGSGERARFLLDINDIPLVLESERVLNFTRDEESRDRLYVQGPGQPRQLVGLRVKAPIDEVETSPLASLSDAEIRGLWGIRICDWSAEVGQKLKLIDPARTCVSFSEESGESANHVLPTLPANLTTLCIQSDEFNNLDELQNLKQLQSLSVFSLNSAPFTCNWLKHATRLESLSLCGCRLSHVDALAGLKELRVLGLDECRDLTSIRFARDMPDLTRLEVSSADIEDLSPLDGHAVLQEIDAAGSSVTTLPVHVPRLRRLRAMSSDLTDDAVRLFRQANPQCKVQRRYNETLQMDLKSATRLRIRTGGTCHRKPEQERILYETRAANEIRPFIAGIQVDEVEDHTGFGCFCCGSTSLEFYDRDELIATIVIHHGSFLAWKEWTSMSNLTPQSAKFLVEWLADRNVPGPREEREKNKRAEQDDKSGQ